MLKPLCLLMETIGLIHCLAHSECSVNVGYHQHDTYCCHNIIMSKSKRISYTFLVYFLSTIDEVVNHTKVRAKLSDDDDTSTQPCISNAFITI